MFFRQIVTIFVLETSYFVFCSFQLLANDCLDLYELLSSDLAYNSNFGIYIMLHFVLSFAHFCVFSLLVSFPDDTSRFYIQTFVRVLLVREFTKFALILGLNENSINDKII